MATYNCSDSEASAYGEGGFGTCESIGAPDTGVFGQIVSSGSFTIVAPLAAALIVAIIASLVMRRRRRGERG